MAKRDRILDAAERLFASQGYAASSHRQVASAAGVSLSAVAYHFGSKSGLFQQVVRRRFVPINTARLELLDQLEKAAHGRPPEVREIVRAFLAPLLDVARRPPAERLWLRLYAWARVERGAHWTFIGDIQGPMFKRFVRSLCESIPQLSADQIGSRLFVLGGGVVKALTDEHEFERVGMKVRTLVEPSRTAHEELIVVVVAGLTAGTEGRGAVAEASPRSDEGTES